MKFRSRLSQRGQSLPLFVLFLPALIAFVALGIDVARLYVERSAEQAAADLAALSGARYLPSSSANATSTATTIATANGYTSGSSSTTVTVTTPYSSDTSKIEVRITRTLPLLFLPILGVNNMDVSARGVARHTPAVAPSADVTNPYGVFAGATSCSGGAATNGVTWSGSNSTITGAVHSEAGIKITSGGNRWNGGTTYRCSSYFTDSGSGNVYNPAPAYQPPNVAWPITYSYADLCGSGSTYYHATGKWDLGTNGAWWVGGTKASLTLNPGVYCADSATAQITLAVQNVVATNVTLVSKGSIDMSGGNFKITPYVHNIAMAAFESGADKQIHISGPANGSSGTIYAPNGEIEFTGPSAGSYNGGLVGLYVTVTGVNFTLIAPASAPSGIPAATPEVLQLTE
jgi:hypothetical protein